MDVRSALHAVRAELAASGIGSADLDAALILGHALGWPRHRVRTEGDRELAPGDVARVRALAADRVRRRPMSQILGRAEFLSLEFDVTCDVLAPRPETEALVEAVLAECGRVLREPRTPVVADVGTGSGCIPVAVAVRCPAADVHTTDVSGPATLVARRNAERHGVASRIVFHRGDLLAPVACALGPASLDVVVSNPPYVRRSEAGECDPEVLWEPACAVFCDGEPAALYARIATDAAPLVRAGGALLLELPGAGSDLVASAVSAIAGWGDVTVAPDLAGLPRVLRARRVAVSAAR